MRKKTITEVRDDLLELFDLLRCGAIDPKVAVEMHNNAGKVISSAKVQLAYHALRGEAPDIPFLGMDVRVEPARRIGHDSQAEQTGHENPDER